MIKSIVRKIQRIIFGIFAFLFLLMEYANASNNDSQNLKRVISVVYDDSYSMTKSAAAPDKQDDLYAKYALENVVAFMNDNDDLNVVRMSNKENYDIYSVNGKSNKENSIKKVESFISNANDTPFRAVETAIDFLKEKKEQYGNSDNIEYWLLVLTDGDFSGSPADTIEYFNNLRSDMSDVKFETVWVFIGNSIKKTFSENLKSVQGTNVIYSDNSEAICDAVYDACSVIYGRPTIKQASFVASNNNKTVTISTEFPVSKVMVYQQDQNVNLESIIVGGKTYSKFESIDVKKQGSPVITSKITQMAQSEILPAGEITFQFDESLNTSENKFMIMLDYALELELGVIGPNGNFEKINTSIYKDGDNASFVARVINLYDNKEVDMSSYLQGLTSSYTYNGQTKNMSFDGSTKTFRFTNEVKTGSNPFSSLLSLTGKFRLKSNVVDIYVPSGPLPIGMSMSNDDVNVSKQLGDYEKVGTKEISFTGFDNEEDLRLNFENVPKGIQIKANGATVKNNKISLRVRGKQKLNLDVYRNKDFSLEEPTQIDITANFKNNEANDRLTNHNLYFNIVPTIRTLKLDVKSVDGIDLDVLNSDNAFNKNLLQVIPMIDGKNISMEELKKSKIEFSTIPKKIKSKIRYKITDVDGQNGFYIYLKPRLNWFTRGENFAFDINMKTSFGEDIASPNHSVSIKNNMLGALIKTFVLLFAIWYIIGIVKKLRLDDKKYKIIVTEDGEEKANEKLRINGGLSSFIPYKAQTGYAYDLSIKAGKSIHSIIILKKSLKEGMIYEGLDVPLDRDLEIAEDTPLILKEGRKKTIYTYTDVVTKEMDMEDTKKGRSTRRTRRA